MSTKIYVQPEAIIHLKSSTYKQYPTITFADKKTGDVRASPVVQAIQYRR
jgi:hypothetical protein